MEGQVMKVFECQTEDFMFDPSYRDKEPLEFTEFKDMT